MPTPRGPRSGGRLSGGHVAGVTVLNLVQHLTWCEHAWFEYAWFEYAWFEYAWFEHAWFEYAWFEHAWFEHAWFEHHFFGEEWCGIDDDRSFDLEPDDTVEPVLARYRAKCDRSRQIAAAAAFDALSVEPHLFFGTVELRWVLTHMIEETARHVGHQDILREETDGTTGMW